MDNANLQTFASGCFSHSQLIKITRILWVWEVSAGFAPWRVRSHRVCPHIDSCSDQVLQIYLSRAEKKRQSCAHDATKHNYFLFFNPLKVTDELGIESLGWVHGGELVVGRNRSKPFASINFEPCGLWTDLNCESKSKKLYNLEGWLIKSHMGGGMVLCFQTTDLSKTFLLFKFDKNPWNIEHVTLVFCATWHSLLFSSTIFSLLKQK